MRFRPRADAIQTAVTKEGNTMTDLSRRRVIGAGAAAIAAGALGVGVPFIGAPGARAADATYTSAESLYRRSRFAPLRGKGFSVTRNGTGTPVTLAEVADLANGRAGSQEQFRLTFTVKGTLPGQGTYTVRRPGFAATSIFLVPESGRKALTAIVDTTR
jgi:hypothetical protein